RAEQYSLLHPFVVKCKTAFPERECPGIHTWSEQTYRRFPIILWRTAPRVAAIFLLSAVYARRQATATIKREQLLQPADPLERSCRQFFKSFRNNRSAHRPMAALAIHNANMGSSFPSLAKLVLHNCRG